MTPTTMPPFLGQRSPPVSAAANNRPIVTADTADMVQVRLIRLSMNSYHVLRDSVANAVPPLRASTRPLVVLLALSSFVIVGTLGAATVIGTQSYTTPGTYSYTVPAATYKVIVNVWGGGGDSNGSNEAKASGGAGGFVTRFSDSFQLWAVPPRRAILPETTRAANGGNPGSL